MLTPQFTLRRLLLLVTVCAVLSLIPVLAGQGLAWVAALLVTATSVVALLFIQAVLYWTVQISGALIERGRGVRVTKR